MNEERKLDLSPEELKMLSAFLRKHKEGPIPPELPDFENLSFEELKEWDKAGFVGLAEGIIEEMERFDTPLIYGIFGKWGSGKTSMMQIIKKILEARGGYATVWFDPWVYEDSDKEMLLIALLRKIQETLSTWFIKICRVIWKYGKWPGFVAIIAGALLMCAAKFLLPYVENVQIPFVSSSSLLYIILALLAALWVVVGVVPKIGNHLEKYANILYRGIDKKQLQKVDAIEARNKKFKGAIKKGLSRVRKETLVLFIDDLDRCLPEKAILLLDQLKNYLEIPDVVTILALDDIAFGKMLRAHCKYDTEPGEDIGRRYLEKIIRSHYRLNNGAILQLLPKYEPLREITNNPRLAKRLFSPLSQVGDLSLRQIIRSLEKFSFIYHHHHSEDLAQFIAAGYDIDIKECPFTNYIYMIYHEIKMEQVAVQRLERYEADPIEKVLGSEEYRQAINIASLVSLWNLVLLSHNNELPLASDSTTTTTNQFAPPVCFINKAYDLFRPYL